ncbi:hypothetical protein [Rhizobium tropici]|uniref:DUF2489 domain-containing protein n=1 Tax=Rhizobium tropici TaxID=398 RepID=A0A329YF45_RHITR|nr:hypothetical protein [Rhizobium tropici]RAX40754.1 hypothetical protein DQ393_15395 [Rhizobium tropici]
MSSVPGWILILQALLTPAIAIAVGAIGFLQWRTAHQKVVLELFDKRLAILTTARSAAITVLKTKNFDEARPYAVDAAIRSRFLFGKDIVAMLWEFQGDVYRATNEGDMFERLKHPEQSAAQRRTLAIEAARKILSELNSAAEPYMKMDQKRVRTPIEWLRDRNRQRLSYADEQQR